MARYWVLVSKELLESKPNWSDFGLTVETVVPAHPRGADWWVKLSDPNAPAELGNSVVDLTFGIDEDGKAAITERTPAY